jgi:hypothetical protein
MRAEVPDQGTLNDVGERPGRLTRRLGRQLELRVRETFNETRTMPSGAAQRDHRFGLRAHRGWPCTLDDRRIWLVHAQRKARMPEVHSRRIRRVVGVLARGPFARFADPIPPLGLDPFDCRNQSSRGRAQIESVLLSQGWQRDESAPHGLIGVRFFRSSGP